MGQFQSGTWIIALIIYFGLFFLLMTSIVNGKQQVLHETDNRITYTDVPFYSQANGYNDVQGSCTGSGKAMNLFGVISCGNIIGVQEDALSCAMLHNCSLVNTTTLFGANSSACNGYIDKEYYNITGTPGSYCYSSGLQSQGLCEAFGCPWTQVNETGLYNAGNAGSTGSVASIWTQIKWIATFSADLGLGSFTWIISLFFFYVPFLMLIWSIYMALPFLH